jgi:glyoxylase-like metal-dependent hydrolase (beta-lactamase superfamily II)
MKSGSPTKYTNKHKPLASDHRFISLWTEPKFAIGQRCILVKTPHGNVLWDCITYLDDDTISWIKSEGRLSAIVISHPHYYTTHLEWARQFDCPVYMSAEDEEWICRHDNKKAVLLSNQSVPRVLIGGEEKAIGATGVKAVKLGGHFPGSLVCLYDGRLLIADTLVTTPSGMGDWKEKGRPKGMNSFAFMWSIPNVRGSAPEGG